MVCKTGLPDPAVEKRKPFVANLKKSVGDGVLDVPLTDLASNPMMEYTMRSRNGRNRSL